MKNIQAVLIISAIAVCINSAPITSLTLTSKQPLENTAVIVIENSNDLLDIRSNADFSALSQEARKWQGLIPAKTSYLLQLQGKEWKGYRYFKNSIHYKSSTYNFTIYHQLVKALLEAHSLQVGLMFEDRYSINAAYDAGLQTWRIQKIALNYAYHVIQEPNNSPPEFSVETSSNSTQQNSFALRKLTGKGLHQQVNLTLQFDLQASLILDPQSCSILIEEILPESTYIDSDQLRTITRYQTINVQKPQYLSKQYFYSYTIPFTKFKQINSRKYNYLYPIHFRYPQPSHLNYTLIALHPSDRIQLTCNSSSLLIEEDPFHTRGHASIFTGSSHDARIVSMATIVLTMVAAMIIIKQLRKYDQ